MAISWDFTAAAKAQAAGRAAAAKETANAINSVSSSMRLQETRRRNQQLEKERQDRAAQAQQLVVDKFNRETENTFKIPAGADGKDYSNVNQIFDYSANQLVKTYTSIYNNKDMDSDKRAMALKKLTNQIPLLKNAQATLNTNIASFAEGALTGNISKAMEPQWQEMYEELADGKFGGGIDYVDGETRLIGKTSSGYDINLPLRDFQKNLPGIQESAGNITDVLDVTRNTYKTKYKAYLDNPLKNPLPVFDLKQETNDISKSIGELGENGYKRYGMDVLKYTAEELDEHRKTIYEKFKKFSNSVVKMTSNDLYNLFKMYDNLFFNGDIEIYMKNSNLLGLSKPEKGNFKVVNLSDFIPQSVVVEPLEAVFAKIREGKALGDVDALEVIFGPQGPVRTFFESYLSTPIGFEPFIDVGRGRTDTGKIIWSSTDSLEDKWNKSWKHILSTLEPGIITSSQKFYDSIVKQPTPSGVLRETGDVLVGASTGLKPFNASIAEALDYKVSDFSRIRTDVFKGEKLYKFNNIYTRGGDVIVDEFVDIQREAFRLQKEIYGAVKAAEAWGMSKRDIRKVFKARSGLSNRQINDIMRGRFTPVNYSQSLFEKKVDILKKREKEQGFDYELNKNFVYPKRGLNRVIRKLKRDKLDEEFYYDKPVKNDLRGFLDQQPINQGVASINTTPPPVPPLPAQPQPVAVAAATPKVNPNTLLTRSESALLSPTEQQIRLNQRT